MGMDGLGEFSASALRVILRAAFEIIVEVLVGYIWPFFEAVYDTTREICRAIVRFDFLAVPLALMLLFSAAGAIFVGVVKLLQWMLL